MPIKGRRAVVTAFMSAGVKAAAFAAFVRVFMSAFGSLQPQWEPIVWMLAAASMILGALSGCRAAERAPHARVLEHRARRAIC